MKKNIFTIIIMALAVVNVVLTAVIVFTVVPSMNRTNNLTPAPFDEMAVFLPCKKTGGETFRHFFLSFRLRLRRIHLPRQREA